MFKLTSSPHVHSGKLTARIMLWVIVAMLPAVAVMVFYFGFGVLIQSALAIGFALLLEFLVTLLRRKPKLFYISDFSVILTALILAVAIPPYAPYWIILIGTFCAVILGKHVYGGLGQNLFNPAMVGYVVLLISFPLQMTTWLPPIQLLSEPPTLADAYSLIFSGVTTDGFSLHQLTASIDGITQATPLDALKTGAKNSEYSLSNISISPIFSAVLPLGDRELLEGIGWTQVNIAFLLGGLLLVWKKIIHWQIPLAFFVRTFRHQLLRLVYAFRRVAALAFIQRCGNVRRILYCYGSRHGIYYAERQIGFRRLNGRFSRHNPHLRQLSRCGGVRRAVRQYLRAVNRSLHPTARVGT